MSTTVLYERRQRLHRGFELITRHYGVHEAEALGVVRREDVPGEQQLVRSFSSGRAGTASAG